MASMTTRAAGAVLGIALLAGACSSSDAAETTATPASTEDATTTPETASASAGDSTESAETEAATDSSESAEGEEDAGTAVSTVFFDGTVHTISVTFDQDDYDAMIAAYQDNGGKEWIEATVTIDGVTYEQVGMRLKGNSSLMGLGGGGFPGGGGFGGGPPEGMEIPEGMELPEGMEIPEGVPGGFGGGGVTAENPEELPWLIRLDKYVDDQSHDGLTELVVRSSSQAGSPLNEAVALDLLGEAGLATQQAAAVRFSVNGSDEALRLVIENPNDEWQAANFDDDGILYKAESTGDWSYRGTDPAAYDEVFDQETNTDEENLVPLIELLQFIEESDDATFAAELPERLDVEAFARYLAFEDLIGNFDNIDGPGNNAYLYWDADSGQFTVVAWDHNLAFSGTGFPGGGGGGPGGGGFGRSNPLVERFMANAEFAAMYDAAMANLRESLVDSGVAAESIEYWSAVITDGAADLVDAAALEQQGSGIADQLAAE